MKLSLLIILLLFFFNAFGDTDLVAENFSRLAKTCGKFVKPKTEKTNRTIFEKKLIVPRTR